VVGRVSWPRRLPLAEASRVLGSPNTVWPQASLWAGLLGVEAAPPLPRVLDGRRAADPLGRKQIGCPVPKGVAAHVDDFAAMGIIKQF
jgi:hypothetical protein